MHRFGAPPLQPAAGSADDILLGSDGSTGARPSASAGPRRVKLPCSPCIHVSHLPPCKGNNICMRLAADPTAEVSLNPPWVLH